MKNKAATVRNVLIFLLLLSTPLAAESIRFAVMGDSRGSGANTIDAPVFSKIVSQVLAIDPPVEFVVVTGDLVRGGSKNGTLAEQFAEWNALVKPWYDSDMLGAKVYPVPGNHDEPSPWTYPGVWQAAFPNLPDNGPEGSKKLDYSFEFGPVHCTVVNTSAPTLLGKHSVDTDWLADDLANTDKPIKLVFGHEPAYPAGPHLHSSLDAKPAKRDAFWKVLVDNHVRAYFCGHEHLYDHWIKDNVHQIITGGAGAPGPLSFHYLIVDADENDVTVTVYKVSDGKVKERYKLSDTKDVPHEDRTDSGGSWFLKNLPCFWLIVLPIGLLSLGGTLAEGSDDR